MESMCDKSLSRVWVTLSAHAAVLLSTSFCALFVPSQDNL